MKSLREIRLVYRNHLLPPLVVPFERITDYRMLFQSSKSLSEQKQNREQLQKTIEVHETVMTQLIKIRNSCIRPLMECPFYYDSLDKKIRSGILSGKYGDKSYMQAIKSIPSQERLKLHHIVQSQYILFRKSLKQIDPNFYEKVVHLPTLKYQSPEDVALSQKKDWNSLSEIEKNEVKQKFQAKVESHWGKLNQIAKQSSLSIEEMVELIKNQTNPPLSSGLKNILFS